MSEKRIEDYFARSKTVNERFSELCKFECLKFEQFARNF